MKRTTVIKVVSLIVIIVSFIVINIVITNEGILRAELSESPNQIVYEIEKLENDGNDFIISGWLIDESQSNNSTNGNSVLLLKEDSIDYNNSTSRYLRLKTYWENRDDVNDYFFEGQSNQNAGFIASVNIESIDLNNEVYRIAFERNEQDGRVIVSDYCIMNGNLIRFGEQRVQSVKDSIEKMDCMKNSVFLGCNEENTMLMFQNGWDLFWVAMDDFYFEEDGSTEVQYQLHTTQNSKLPHPEWNADNLSFAFEEHEITDAKEKCGYRIAIQSIPKEYPVTYIWTGYHTNQKGWVWINRFLPRYKLNDVENWRNVESSNLFNDTSMKSSTDDGIIYSDVFRGQKESIFNMPASFFYAYAGELCDGIPYAGMQDNGLDFINYYTQASNVIYSCVAFNNGVISELNSAIEVMDCLMDTFSRNGKFPRPIYSTAGYEYGWVSSMDAPTIMIGAQMLYELTGDTKYQSFVQDLLNYVVKTTAEGGFNLYISEDKLWPLEYAREISTPENSMFVLNGSLVGFNALVAMNMLYKCEELEEYIQKMENAYISDLSKFHYENDSWTYYMLNKKTVIPIHYLIFEEKLFECASDLRCNQIFESEYQFRRTLLQDSLKADFFDEEDGIHYYMIRSSSPHYYLLDCYKTKIEIYDGNDNLIHEDISQLSGTVDCEEFYKGFASTGVLRDKSVSYAYYKVYSDNGAGWYLLFEDDICINQISDEENTIFAPFSASCDGILDNTTLLIDSELSELVEGRCTFDIPMEEGIYAYAIELDNRENFEITNSIVLYDDTRYGVSRYYTTLLPGKNVLVFDAKGFVDSANLSNISKIAIRLYDSNFDKATVDIGNVYRFKNNRDIYYYLLQSEYKIHPQ